MCPRPSGDDDLWETALLRKPQVKRFFSNREREITWRTVQNAYKWNAWMAQRNIPSNPNCCFCNFQNGDDINHLLLQCPVIAQLWQHCHGILQQHVTRAFIIDDPLTNMNHPGDDEDQLEWIVPIKLINIIKIKIMASHRSLKGANRAIDNTSEWVEKITLEAREDLSVFISNIREKHPVELQNKMKLKTQ